MKSHMYLSIILIIASLSFIFSLFTFSKITAGLISKALQTFNNVVKVGQEQKTKTPSMWIPYS